MLRLVNFWLAALVSATFLGIAVYCLRHGVTTWSSVGFAAFFWLLASAVRPT